MHEEVAVSVKVGSHSRVHEGLRSHTLEELAAQWKAWSVCDRPISQAVTRADVKANIAVKQVASPVTSDARNMHEASLMLMECDSGAQRSFIRTFELDSCGSTQFWPPTAEADWYDLIGRILDARLTQ